MTTAYERTNAVVETRKLLQLLACTTTGTELRDIRETAQRLLRHYPLNVDLDISAATAPGVWAPPRR